MITFGPDTPDIPESYTLHTVCRMRRSDDLAWCYNYYDGKYIYEFHVADDLKNQFDLEIRVWTWEEWEYQDDDTGDTELRFGWVLHHSITDMKVIGQYFPDQLMELLL